LIYIVVPASYSPPVKALDTLRKAYSDSSIHVYRSMIWEQPWTALGDLY